MLRHIIIIVSLFCCDIFMAAQPLCDITKYDEDNGMAQWHVTRMLQDGSGMIWLATWNGLNRFDGYQFDCFKTHAGDGCKMATDRVRDIWTDAKGNIICKVDEQFFTFNLNTYRFASLSKSRGESVMAWREKTKYRSKIITNKVGNILHTDKSGNHWAIDHHGRIFYQERGSKRMMAYNGGVPLDSIKSYMPDREGNLWLIGMSGVYKLTFKTYPSVDFPQERKAQVRCLFLDKDNNYWVTTKDDATVRIFDRHNRLIGYLQPDGGVTKKYTSFTAPIYCITQTRSGDMWLGSKPAGLFRLRKGRNGRFVISNYRDKDTLSNSIYDIKEDRTGRLWIATLGGGIVVCTQSHDGGSPQFRHVGPADVSRKVRYLLITRNQTLIAATTEGILIGDISKNGDPAKTIFRRHIKEPDRETSLSCNATMDILEDSRHRIFISTESGGINEITSANPLSARLNFRHYNMSAGMPSDVVLSMTEHNGTLWVVGSNRIMVLQPGKNVFKDFGIRFFHEPYRYSDAHPLRLPDGRWMFGLQNGAFTMNESMMKGSGNKPNIVLTGISIQNRAVDMAADNLTTLTLRPDERSLTVYFSALNYSDPAGIGYSFRVNGGTWNNLGKGRSTTFIDMKPGTYKLEIRSTNSDGVWMNNIRTLNITVKPKFSETVWALLLFIMTGIIITATVIYTIIYIRAIKRKQRETLEAYLALMSKHAGHDDGMEDVKAKPDGLSAADDAFLKRVMSFVEEHLSDSDVLIDDMAAAAATSHSGLNRKMKSILGITPLEFLREARLKQACQLLRETNMPVNDIAYRCGFTDPKYFSRCFKSSIGLSPSAYKSEKAD